MTQTIIEALADPDLFASLRFDRPSWRPWIVFLRALFALPMNDPDLEIYRHHTGRQAPPARAARYAELVVGRRGGKSRILALIATYLATVPDHSEYIVPGETPVIAVIAADRKQAKIILNYITGTLRAVPVTAEMIEDELVESVTLNNGVAIEVHTASIAAPRGRTFLAVLADESAFWPTGDSANPDVEIINAVRPGLSTIPYSLLLIASSPYAKRGVLYQNYSRYFGKDDAPVLVWQGTTREMNSSLIDDPLIDEMYAEDAERASAEYGAQFRSDIIAFITREAIEDVTAHGIRELPAGGGITYAGFVDPSGGSADSFTLAIGHIDQDGIAVLDAVRETKPPFSPDAVVEEYAALLKLYGLTTVTGDAYAGEWPRERFAAHGITYELSKKSKSVIYGEFLPALNGRRVRLLDIPRLTGQLIMLERRTARGGRDSIDHAPGSHDDVANVACGVLVRVISDRRPGLVRQDDLLVEDAPLPLPTRALGCFATMSISTAGQMAVVYTAPTPDGTLMILDFDAGPLRNNGFTLAVERLLELGRLCAVSREAAVALYVEPFLVPQARVAGFRASPIPADYLDVESLLVPVALAVADGLVKVCQPAHDKAKTLPFGGALDFRSGDAAADNPLRTAALQAIALSAVPRRAMRRVPATAA